MIKIICIVQFGISLIILIDAIDIGNNIILKNSYDNIEKLIIAGMGGSAIGGDVVAILGKEKLKTPLFVIRDYTLPSWIDDKNLNNMLIIFWKY